MKQFIACPDKKIGVFKIAKQAKVKDDAHNKKKLFPAFLVSHANKIGKNKINNSRDHHKNNKSATGFIKKIQREKTEDISSQHIIIPAGIIQCNKNSKEKNKEPVVE
jgi:hypothetical protein